MDQVRPSSLFRVVDLEAGVAMVVTDLHGDWNVYQRYRDRFLDLEAHGRADTLIFTGDLIHSDGSPEEDRSLDIVLDVMALRARLGDRIIYLLGNHELVHLYGITLQKGTHLYTPAFEAAMGEHRVDIVSFFDGLPVYARTQAGVSLCHAGAFAGAGEPGVMLRLLSCSHQRIWEEVSALLSVDQRTSLRSKFARLDGESYDDIAHRYLAVSGPDDPRYDDLLIGSVVSSTHPEFRLLWAALFTGNEWECGEDEYALHLDAMLWELSRGFHQQRVLVAGHMACSGGYALIAGGHQLRLASGSHAYPFESGRYLLFDMERPVRQADKLLDGLGGVFE
ncbi:MAG: metallophosphoesterase family protein [Anaerolineae bacterium]